MASSNQNRTGGARVRVRKKKRQQRGAAFGEHWEAPAHVGLGVQAVPRSADPPGDGGALCLAQIIVTSYGIGVEREVRWWLKETHSPYRRRMKGVTLLALQDLEGERETQFGVVLSDFSTRACVRPLHPTPEAKNSGFSSSWAIKMGVRKGGGRGNKSRRIGKTNSSPKRGGIACLFTSRNV